MVWQTVRKKTDEILGVSRLKRGFSSCDKQEEFMTHVSDTDDSLYLTLFSSLPDKESSNRSSISEERRY